MELPELPLFGQASNTLVCGWYLGLFALIAVAIVLGAFGVFIKTWKSPMSVGAKVATLLAVTLVYAAAMITPAFQYTLCKRALL